MKARVTIEEGWLGDERWAVIITRPDRLLRRTLWERYPSQALALKGAVAARAYLRDTVGGVEEARPRYAPGSIRTGVNGSRISGARQRVLP